MSLTMTSWCLWELCSVRPGWPPCCCPCPLRRPEGPHLTAEERPVPGPLSPSQPEVLEE